MPAGGWDLAVGNERLHPALTRVKSVSRLWRVYTDPGGQRTAGAECDGSTSPKVRSSTNAAATSGGRQFWQARCWMLPGRSGDNVLPGLPYLKPFKHLGFAWSFPKSGGEGRCFRRARIGLASMAMNMSG